MGKITILFYVCNMWILSEIMSTFFSRRPIARNWRGRLLVVAAASLLHYLLLPFFPAGTLLRTISYLYITIAVVWVQHKGKLGKMAAAYAAFLGFEMVMEYTIRSVQEYRGISLAEAMEPDQYFLTFCLQMFLEIMLLIAVKYIAGKKQKEQGSERETPSGNSQISALIAQLDENVDKDFTDHTGLNILLNAKYAQAVKKGIKCQIDIQSFAGSGIDQVDLLTMAGDILDYGMQGTEMEFRVGAYKNALLMRCKSFFNSNVPDNPCLKETAMKYDGTFEWEKKEDLMEVHVILWARM